MSHAYKVPSSDLPDFELTVLFIFSVAKTRMDFMKKYEDVFVDIPAVKTHIKTAKDRLQDADDAANKAQLELDSMTILLSLNGHS